MLHSIRYKFIIITTVLIIFSANLVFFLAINEHEDLYRQSVKQNLDAMSSNISDSLLRVMSEQVDLFSITTELLGFDRYEHIKFVNVFDADWQLIQSYVHPNYLELESFKPELISIQPKNLPYAVTITNEGLVALKAIGEEQFPIGYLLIVQDFKKPLNESKISLFYSAAPFVVLIIALTIIISFWIYQRLLSPLLALSKFTQKVEKSTNYKLQYQVTGHDEVSQLGNDINALLQTIDSQVQTNHKHTAQLLVQTHSMERLANYDILTGLPNRMFFMDLLKLELASSKSNDQDVAIMFFDVDSFKGVNDTLGHETGDMLLQAVAKKVKSYLRSNDIIARLGGDEFLIMLPNITEQSIVIDIAENIIESMKEPFTINEWDVPAGISIGIASAKEAEFDINTFISNADIAMYTSKEKGKGAYTIFHHKMLEDNKRKAQVANLISHAIAQNEFELFYQLKMSNTGETQGLEALIRWQSKELGFVSPSEFIPIAEQAGKIKAITQWVITQVFKDMQMLKQLMGNNVLVSMNLSSHDLKDHNFIHTVKSKLLEHSVDISNIQFEITESSYLENFENANQFFNQVKVMGGSIALDDFGTGYSSLSYLTKIEIDTLKIDRMFVNQYASSAKDTAVLQAILDLGQRLGLKICSEGIETTDQANYLVSNGSDEMQGYYFAKPVCIAQLPHAIERAKILFKELTITSK
ncbi:bifunctional diguanylate cyclase/phosphodiesterase [Pseudoalteromonas sp. SR43-5]|uniref:putative bifunctional diguanylate cyclase/phosphodiesterase n=1 Tax=Pseudoalteromonas sp. SR43-5 TaxID=2760941 RepID=UPI0015F7D227|nr:EAL domain-containing protein [Pseudoalteromonas sp. SR43-5]MBB1307197.1 EAL domain-containing protein [Pseudoalteromonas sp. SR43-5]